MNPEAIKRGWLNVAFTEEDFQLLFERFNSTASGSTIKDLYSIMPAFSEEQILVLQDAYFFARKYDLQEVEAWLKGVIEYRCKNRSLGFLPSFKNFLKYMTLEEKLKGFKLNAGNTGDER